MCRCAIRILAAAAVAAAPACGKKKRERPPPAAKPISPPAVEPLPAPRARGQLPSPAGTPDSTLDAGARPRR